MVSYSEIVDELKITHKKHIAISKRPDVPIDAKVYHECMARYLETALDELEKYAKSYEIRYMGMFHE